MADLRETVFLALGQASMAQTPDQVAKIGEELLARIDQDRPEAAPEKARTEINCTGASTQTSWQPSVSSSRNRPLMGFGRG